MDHHYVPRFLLSKWIGPNTVTKNAVFEFRLRLAGVPVRERAPASTGYEKDLLKLNVSSAGDDALQAIEKVVMQSIDTAAASVLDVLLNDGIKNLTASQRCDWARFISSIRIRQPHFVQHNVKSNGATHLLAELNRDPEEYRLLAGPDDPPTLVEWLQTNHPGTIENFGLQIMPGAIDHKSTIEQVINLHWGVCDFHLHKNELLLSDNPAIIRGALWSSPTFLIALPISPTKLFLACRARETVRRLLHTKPREIITWVNESSIMQANQWVYARTTSPGRFIRNRVAQLRSNSSSDGR